MDALGPNDHIVDLNQTHVLSIFAGLQGVSMGPIGLSWVKRNRDLALEPSGITRHKSLQIAEQRQNLCEKNRTTEALAQKSVADKPEQFTGINNDGNPPAFWEMAFVAGDEIVGRSSFGAFEKAVVRLFTGF